MKKVYMTPMIVYEDAATTTSLTTSCGETSGATHAWNDCTFDVPEWGMSIFIDLGRCDMTPEEGGVCYHSPTADTSIFSS